MAKEGWVFCKDLKEGVGGGSLMMKAMTKESTGTLLTCKLVHSRRYQLSFQWPEVEVREYTVEELQELIQDVIQAKTDILKKLNIAELWDDFSERGYKFGEDLMTGLDVATYLKEKGTLTWGMNFHQKKD